MANKDYSFNLKSNLEGYISLGKLNGIKQIDAEMQAFGDLRATKRTWMIN